MRTYISNLAPLINDFLEFKHALGIKYETASYYLMQLDKYNYIHKNVTIPDQETVEGWVLMYEEKSVTRNRSWISPIREFGRYLQSCGIREAYVLHDKYSIQKYHAEVYLMTELEIQCFFEECDRYVLRYKLLGRAYVFPALYRFLYCCGVRCCEARQTSLRFAITDYIRFYSEERPQDRYQCKTPLEVRMEALSSDKPVKYPIPKNKRIEKYKQKWVA